ncbi:polysaccharide deacetylase family protein [Proteocatella sphenisci]|uniref:hypothetical protein n=1 Tax=Proteocatella sphenisci TaxID=181070 RepID=UPI000490E824|nr:hypothetical protein [Proteocatella sphenisci]
MNFTYLDYTNMIKNILNGGYDICNYENIRASKKGVVLRHDVDFDLKKALEMAKLEYSIGVSSTYFVLISTDFYNICSKKSVAILNEIIEMNHDIGLHFDEQRYEMETIIGMKKEVLKEVSIIQKIINKPIKTISMHRPSKLTLESNVHFEGLINSYSSYFFKDMKYISDSRMHWREDTEDVINCNNYNKIHILTHPFWYSNKIENTREKLTKFINEAKLSRYESMNLNFRDLDQYIHREEIY